MGERVCEWCGHDHPVTALCTKRPRWSRRGFLALMGAAAVGTAVDPSSLLKPAWPEAAFVMEFTWSEGGWILGPTMVRGAVTADRLRSLVQVTADRLRSLVQVAQRAVTDQGKPLEGVDGIAVRATWEEEKP